MWAYVRDIYQLPGIAETVDQEHIMRHYYVCIASYGFTFLREKAVII